MLPDQFKACRFNSCRSPGPLDKLALARSTLSANVGGTVVGKRTVTGCLVLTLAATGAPLANANDLSRSETVEFSATDFRETQDPSAELRLT